MQQQVLAHFPGLPGPAHPVQAKRGFSGAQVWCIESPDGHACALRAWPPTWRDGQRIRWIHRQLHAIAEAGFRLLPIPLRTAHGDTLVHWQDRYWDVAAWLPGQADYWHDPHAQRLRGAVETLAEFHQAGRAAGSVEVAAGTSPALLSRAALLRELQHGGLDQLRMALECPPSGVHVARSLQEIGQEILASHHLLAPRLEQQVQQGLQVPLELSLCHGDLWHDHILFCGRQVGGFVDFDNLHIDTPLVDLARMLGSLVGDDRPQWRAAEDWYFDCQPSAAPLDARRVVRALDQAGVLLSGVNWLRWILLDQRQFDWQQVEPRLVAIGQRLHELRRSID